MKRGIVTALLLAGWLSVGVNFASAQFGTLGQSPARPRPTVSPYINQGAGGINAYNYYGIIKPQFEANRQFNELQRSLNPDGSLRSPLQQASDQPQSQTGLQTGHPATYFNYGHYFPLSPPIGGGSSLGGTSGFGLGGGYSPNLGVSPTTGGFNQRNFYGPNFGVVVR